MEGQTVLFEWMWVKWTIPLIATAIAGTITAIATLYKLHERWATREQRRLDMLHEYVDKEEKNITEKRKAVLAGIQAVQACYLEEKKFDVGAEIDEAIKLLDKGRPDRAVGRLAELSKKLDANAAILERRASDLRKHMASVQIFMAALADADGDPAKGLGYVTQAIQNDAYDADALKYQGLLYLNKAAPANSGEPWHQLDLDAAERSFDRLRQYSNGSAAYRADAYLGLGSVALQRGAEAYDEAERRLNNALQNLNSLPPAEQDQLTRAHVHQQLGTLFRKTDWGKANIATATDHFEKALAALNKIQKRRGIAAKRHRDVTQALHELRAP